MTDLTQAIAEVKRSRADWAGDIHGVLSSHAKETICRAVASGELVPLADAKLAVAEAYRKAAGGCLAMSVRVAGLEDDYYGDPREYAAELLEEQHETILALADTDALAEVQALRAERDGLLRAAHDNHEADKRAEAAEAELAATQAKLARLETLPPDFGHDGLRWKIGIAMFRNIEAAHPQTDRTAALYHAFRAGLRAALEGAKP